MVTLVADEDKHLFLDTFGLDNVRQAYHDGKDDLRISFYFIVQRKSVMVGYLRI